jgi:hypothetical protein
MFQRDKKITVKMCNVVKEMRHHMPESFLGNHILLSAFMTIPALHNGAAVQAILFIPVWDM